eukprot:5237853-Pyramimonas_sp.AAC.1
MVNKNARASWPRESGILRCDAAAVWAMDFSGQKAKTVRETRAVREQSGLPCFSDATCCRAICDGFHGRKRRIIIMQRGPCKKTGTWP